MSSLSPASPLLNNEITLKSGLQSVLRSLDVGLEDELTRYRRKKRAEQPLAARQQAVMVPGKGSGKTVRPASTAQVAREAIAQLNAISGRNTPSPQGSAPTPVPSLPSHATALGAISPSISPSRINTWSPTEAIATDQHSSTQTSSQASAAPLSFGAVPLESSLVNLGQQVSEPESPGPEASEEAYAPEAGTAINSTTALSSTNESDDYFASSAALLESLNHPASPEEEPVASHNNPRVAQLLSPAGIGVSMLLLLGSATAGYLMLHPDSLSHLQLAQRWSGSPEAEASNGTRAIKTVNPELPPGAPDLSQKEFVDLKLSNLGILNLNERSSTGSNGTSPAAPSALLPTNGLSNPAPAGAPVVGGGGSATSLPAPSTTASSGLLSSLANAVAAPASAPAPTIQMGPAQPLPQNIPASRPAPIKRAPAAPAPANPSPVVSAPKPLPAPPVLAPAPLYEAPSPADEVSIAPAPSNDVSEAATASSGYGTFVVVTPYNSDLALSQVQQIVPDAFVDNTPAGAFIQAGIFDDAATAQSLVDQLQREGLSASVQER